MYDERLDIILAVLRKMIELNPRSNFLESLYGQYCERGSLSKGQLEGLNDMASRNPNINHAHLATLQAIIMKKKSFYRSPIIKEAQVPIPDITMQLISEILSVYPEHKRAIFLSMKLKCGKLLDAGEKADVIRLHGILLKKKDS